MFAGTESASSFAPSSLTVCMYNKKISISVLLLRQLTTARAQLSLHLPTLIKMLGSRFLL